MNSGRAFIDSSGECTLVLITRAGLANLCSDEVGNLLRHLRQVNRNSAARTGKQRSGNKEKKKKGFPGQLKEGAKEQLIQTLDDRCLVDCSLSKLELR